MTHSEETKRAAVAAYESGLTTAEVAEKLFVHSTTVLIWCRASGVSVRPKGTRIGTAKKCMGAVTHFGRLVQDRRLELGLCLRELGKSSRCSIAYLSSLENRPQFPGILKASRIAAALNIPLQDLADAAELDAKEKEGTDDD